MHQYSPSRIHVRKLIEGKKKNKTLNQKPYYSFAAGLIVYFISIKKETAVFLVSNGNNNPVYETAKETLMYRTVLWTLWERERVGRFGRMALKHVKYHV